MEKLLEVRDLKISFYTYRGVVKALEGVSFSMDPGESVGLVGETGCGKSVTARAIMGFIEPPGQVESGEILLEGQNLLIGPRCFLGCTAGGWKRGSFPSGSLIVRLEMKQELKVLPSLSRERMLLACLKARRGYTGW